MQQALEALYNMVEDGDRTDKQQAMLAITALHTALEQPEQEPVETYIHHYRSQSHPNDFGIPKGHWWQAKQYADAVNTTPPAAQPEQVVDCPRCGHVCSQRPWVGLTPEEILDLFDRVNVYGSKWIEFARAVEAKLKAKNDH
jgi:hypothetical protein